MRSLIFTIFLLVVFTSVAPVMGQQCDFSSFKPFRAHHYPESAVARKVSPRFPIEAKRAGIYGSVAVKVLVNKRGRVIRTCVIEGDKVFRKNARKAARNWVFKEDSLGIIGTSEDPRPKYLELVIRFNFGEQKGQRKTGSSP